MKRFQFVIQNPKTKEVKMRNIERRTFNDAVVDLIAESAKEERFMMAIHSCVLHAPGDRNYPWSRLYDQRGYKGKNRFRYSRSGTSMIAANMDEDDSVVDITHQDHNIYDSGMHMADAMVKQIVDGTYQTMAHGIQVQML